MRRSHHLHGETASSSTLVQTPLLVGVKGGVRAGASMVTSAEDSGDAAEAGGDFRMLEKLIVSRTRSSWGEVGVDMVLGAVETEHERCVQCSKLPTWSLRRTSGSSSL